MSTEARSQVGKANVLIISVVLVVLLSISNAWFLYTNQSLQNQISALETENIDLQEQIGTLQSQIDSLESQNNELQSEIVTLKAPQLYKVSVQWTDHQNRYPSPFVSIQGSIFNSGSEPAHNAILTVRIFDGVSTLLKSEEIHIGTIAGKSYNAFDVDIQYSGRADSVTTTITYD